MKIALAQIQSTSGEVDKNVQQHLRFIEKAATLGAQLVIFPELSLTNYEPKLATKLAMTVHDPVFEPFKKLSQQLNISIGIGIPNRVAGGIQIALLLFSRRACLADGQAMPQVYAKRFLHADELPYFIPGRKKIILPFGQHRIAPAICYESLLPEHAEEMVAEGATVYLASVAKSEKGIQKAYPHYAKIAANYEIPVLMVNGIGSMDDFVGAGQSGVWSSRGKLLDQLADDAEGLLLINMESMEIHTCQVNV